MENNTGLTNRKKALSIYKWTLRKYLPFSIAYWILLFLTFPIIEIGGMIVSSSLCKEEKISMVKYYTRDIEELAKIIPGSVFAAVVVLFSAILTIMAFSYMHNKRAVDLFGSFPVSRRTLFFSRYLAVLTACIVPMILIGGIGAALTLKGSAAITVIKTLAILLLEIIGNVSFISFISLCCGTVADVIICYGVINIVYPICVFICHIFPKTVLPGIPSGYMPDTVFTLLCPLAAGFVAVWGKGMMIHVIWWIALSIILVAGCYVLCKKRKAETAQNAFAFAIVEIVIKFATAFTGGFGVGWVMAYVGQMFSVKAQYLWFAIGLASGILVVNILLHLIFHRGLSKFKNSLVECAVVFVTGMSFLLIVTSGVFGYDTRIPDIKDVKEVSIKDGDESFTVNGVDILEKYTDDSEFIGEALEFHQQIIDMITKDKKIFYPITNGKYNSYNNSFYNNITVVYKLTNGKEIRRTFKNRNSELKIPDMFKDVAINKADMINRIPKKYLRNLQFEQVVGIEEKDRISYVNVDLLDREAKAKWNNFIDVLYKDVNKYGVYEGSDYEYAVTLNFYNSSNMDSINCLILIPDSYQDTINEMYALNYGNIAYWSLKEYGSMLDFEDTSKVKITEEREIYFKVPKGWDENAPIQCSQIRIELVDDEWEENAFFVDVDDENTKCEKVADGLWKYTLKSAEENGVKYTYDYVRFYQIGEKRTFATSNFKLDEKKNLLEIPFDESDICTDGNFAQVDDGDMWSVYKK